MRVIQRRAWGFAIACTALIALSCSSGDRRTGTHAKPDAAASLDAGAATSDAGSDAGVTVPFVPDPPAVYVAKVKNVLLGLPPTDAELEQVTRDPAQLAPLIRQWMKQPEYAQKMQRFFELAFQQTQIGAIDFADQTYPKPIGLNPATIPLLIQNAQQSFSRTVLELIAEGKPLTTALTTHRYMLTTALRELYAFLDVWQVDDDGKVKDGFRAAHKDLTISVSAASGPIPIEQTLDPSSPNYMHWYDPDVTAAGARDPGCDQDPFEYPPSAQLLHYVLYGSLDNRKLAGTKCRQFPGTAQASQFAPEDFSDWKMVTIRAPKSGESVSQFYDLPALRSADELVLQIPRTGFFSTPAFFANWQTNISNQMRVTINQTLIVALGAAIDGSDMTTTPGNPPPGLDTDHASASECFFCHQTLDPLRSILSATYSWNYHAQSDPTFAAQKGMFAFHGVIEQVASLDDLGAQLANHPLFATAWAQKLCAYVNSTACADDDPELARIVDAFRSSDYDWNTLVVELLASPITTHARATRTASKHGEVVAVARRDHLCFALSRRLGLTDVCGLDRIGKKKVQKAVVAAIAAGLPSDGYGRGATMPVLPNEPTLFFRAGVENMCAALAVVVVDPPAAQQVDGAKRWSGQQPDAAIDELVSLLMALPPSDPRAPRAKQLLRDHFDAAMQQGKAATAALRSTFVTACVAPSAISIGM
jgi:hypothetical protein